jgi:antitoxin (DNA-binding transcriptional repressor) of toxin-antitoxin stability system
MKAVSVGEAQSHLGKILDEVLDGQLVLIARGRRRVLLQPLDSAEAARDWVEYCRAFPPAPREPKGTTSRIRRINRRVRQNGERGD